MPLRQHLLIEKMGIWKACLFLPSIFLLYLHFIKAPHAHLPPINCTTASNRTSLQSIEQIFFLKTCSLCTPLVFKEHVCVGGGKPICFNSYTSFSQGCKQFYLQPLEKRGKKKACLALACNKLCNAECVESLSYILSFLYNLCTTAQPAHSHLPRSDFSKGQPCI